MENDQPALKVCPVCNIRFKPRQKNQYICSAECRRKDRKIKHSAVSVVVGLPKVHCPICGTNFDPRRRKQRFCSARCRLAQWLKCHPKPAQ